MQKKITKAAVMMYITAIHPIISCLIWILLTQVMQTLSALSIIRDGLALLQIFVMVISSALLYCLIKRKQYLYPYQLKTMLAVSHVMFMIIMGLVAVKCVDFLPEEMVSNIGLLIFYTLCMTGIFLIVFLVVMVIECIIREVKANKKGLQGEHEERIYIIENPKTIIILCKAVICSFISCLTWFTLMWISFLLPNNIPSSLSHLYWFMQIVLFIIVSVLVYYWGTGKQNLEFFQLRKGLVCLNIFSMVILFLVYLSYPDFLPSGEGPVLAVAISVLFTLACTGCFLGSLFLAVIIEYIIRKATKPQVPKQDDSRFK